MHDEVCVEYDEATEQQCSANRQHKLKSLTPEEHLQQSTHIHYGGICILCYTHLDNTTNDQNPQKGEQAGEENMGGAEVQ